MDPQVSAGKGRPGALGGLVAPQKPPTPDLKQTLLDKTVAGMVRSLQFGAETLGRTAPLRRAIVGAYDRRLRASYERTLAAGSLPVAVARQRYYMASAILHTMERAMAEDLLGASTLRGALNIIARTILMPHSEDLAKEQFKAGRGTIPPSALVISPSKACNLRCTGCYADSGSTCEKLDWSTFSRIVWEARRLWGVRFFGISGGEPLAYRDAGRGILDMAEEHRDCFFMMYTNGTLIDEDTARRMGDLGNITPAISVEGMKRSTDARRGAGVFERVLQAMGYLRQYRVPFGLSMTATRDNHQELLSDTLMDLFFGRMGALYGWLFHYMPIGRSYTLDLMPTPQQRIWMLNRMWDLIGQRHYFLLDLWNSGTLSDGCISAGGRGGYFYIDWNGAVSPCVFVPYSPVNINDVYARNQTLNDVFAEPFFARIRDWQQAYNPGTGAPGEHPDGNLLRPCPFRDHHAEFQAILDEHEPEPIDDNARAALLDPAYHEGLEQYDRELAELLDPVWEAGYTRRA